jgi:hypothetical protein
MYREKSGNPGVRGVGGMLKLACAARREEVKKGRFIIMIMERKI